MDEISFLYNKISYLYQAISYNTLKKFMGNTLNLCVKLALENDDSTHLEKNLKSLTVTLNKGDLNGEQRTLFQNFLKNVIEMIPAEHKVSSHRI